MAQRDDNDMPILYGVSHLDGVTPVKIKFDPSTRAIMIDATTSIAFDPTIVRTVNQTTALPFAMATSSSDNTTIAPWVVNASTGAVLVAT